MPPLTLFSCLVTLWSNVLVAKYCDHLPLYRQESIYRSRHGVELSRQLLAQWVEKGAHWLTTIYFAMRDEAMGGGYLQIDETPIRYLDPGHGKTRLGYLWTCHQPGGESVYSWHLSRAVPVLRQRWVVSGLVFGAAAYFVMTWFVVPMSNAGNQQITFALPVTPVMVNGILIHMFGVGLPAAYFASRR